MNDHMTKCSNCEGACSDGKYLTVLQGRQVVALVCGTCLDGVLMCKIAISRPDASSSFTYEQYLPVSSAKA